MLSHVPFFAVVFVFLSLSLHLCVFLMNLPRIDLIRPLVASLFVALLSSQVAVDERRR